MRINEIITEGRDAYLYHATSAVRAASILRDDAIYAQSALSRPLPKKLTNVTFKDLEELGYFDNPDTDDVYDRLLTLNQNRFPTPEEKAEKQTLIQSLVGNRPVMKPTAIHGISLTRDRSFAHRWQQANWWNEPRVVFVLNQRQMVLDGHQLIPDRHPDSNRYGGDQAEEFHVGQIKPLGRYLISIEMTSEHFNIMKDRITHGGIDTKGNREDIDGANIYDIKRLLSDSRLVIRGK